ncbi:hypothetical protein RMATCC62417_06087 [Rhizopus microsporus]|nr:hypothetical protein RMATCC62417_06087 [Rhizopus microsporus]CEJ01621.1 hypothetical protein RMCBS344292_15644 [Rhizopus microsporus]
MRKFRIKKEPFSRTGFFFTFLGFLLILLCLIGCQTPGSKSLYFVKVTDAPSYKGSPMSAYYGWRGYCIDDRQTNCYGHDVLVVPLDVSISSSLNITYPRLFTDAISPDTDLNPGAAPNPAHDPKIFPAAVLCLLCSGVSLFLGLWKWYQPHKYADQHYTRGFLAASSAVLALLLVALSSVMYQNAVYELNVMYPNLVASEGPSMIMVGVAFGSFFIAAIGLLRGVLNADMSAEGYNAI